MLSHHHDTTSNADDHQRKHGDADGDSERIESVDVSVVSRGSGDYDHACGDEFCFVHDASVKRHDDLLGAGE
jgi:hypothetical protein